ncbi:hypothetical protein M422DRAFT_238701 [Sphaerobolus stellatus SS14]|nr:hypothetical protein M422DRAFT_238701 [Sphaerobolus stellatus SS14]
MKASFNSPSDRILILFIGTATGKIEKIARVDVYVAIPQGEYEREKALLFLPDALGLALPNSQTLKADDFASNGVQTYVIDICHSEPVPISVFEDPEAWEKYDRWGWVERHSESVTRAQIDPVIAALKGKGIIHFGVTGYCFGGKYVFNLAQENIIKVGAVAHPSLESCEMADKLLGEGKYEHDYKRIHWPGCTHGFAVKGDMNDPNVKAGKEGAFKETAACIKKHL